MDRSVLVREACFVVDDRGESRLMSVSEAGDSIAE